MRIGVNCFLLAAHIGGLKQYFINLFNWLLEHDHNNDYVFFHFDRNAAELAKLGTNHWRKDAILLEDQAGIRRHLGKLDLYFCPFSALWPRPVPLPSVMTLVDIQEVFYPKFFTPSDLFNRAYHYKPSTRAADHVITISEFSRRTLIEHHGLSPEKVTVAHLCADPAYFSAPDIEVPPDGAVPFTNFVFYPANRWHHKSHDVILRAMALLKERGTRVNAVFTGFDMAGGYPLMTRARQYGVADQVHSAGYITVPQMAYLYRRAEALLFPSLFEGFGMPPVEAMAAGCPVAASTSTCPPEICGDAAEYFNPNSPEELAGAICRIREQASVRQSLIDRGRARARLFSVEKMARAHLDAFDRAVNAYAPLKYIWHRFAYQPYNVLQVHGSRLLGRFESGARDGSGCRIVFGRGWYPPEGSEARVVRWTHGTGRVSIEAPRSITLQVRGEIASCQYPNEIRVVANGNPVLAWTVEGKFEFRSIPEFQVELRQGNNILEFVSTNPGLQSSSEDPRKLAIALRDLSFADPAAEIECTIAN